MRNIRLLSVILLCVFAPVFSSVRAYPTLDRKEEREMGKQIERDAAKQFNSVEDPYVTEYIGAIVKKLAKASRAEEFEVRVHVIQSPVVNAFTVPGGVIFLTTGIIFSMDSEEELAGIIAHEMGHVEGRHIAFRMEKGKVMGLASAAAIMASMMIGARINPKLGEAALAFGMAEMQTKLLSYSRIDEDDADRRGARAMEAAGYGPAGLISFMEKLGRYSPSSTEIPSYLLTHPAPNDRVTMLKLSVKKNQPPPDPSKEYFWVFQARVVAADPKPWAAKTVEDRATSFPANYAALLGDAVYQMSLGRFDQAHKLLDLCEAQNHGSVEASHLRALIELNSGQSESGIKRLEMIRSGPNPTLGALRDLGWAYLEKDRGTEALAVYDALAVKDPDWQELSYRRGMALGKIGREGEAHLELGRYYLENDHPSSRRHLEKALALLPAGAKKEEASSLLEKLKTIEKEEQHKSASAAP